MLNVSQRKFGGFCNQKWGEFQRRAARDLLTVRRAHHLNTVCAAAEDRVHRTDRPPQRRLLSRVDGSLTKKAQLFPRNDKIPAKEVTAKKRWVNT